MTTKMEIHYLKASHEDLDKILLELGARGWTVRWLPDTGVLALWSPGEEEAKK